jgi:ubiquinone/menaquinone biosynthesis C-methylase UbiE
MRCDYDAIAEAYDRQPVRIKEPDRGWLDLCATRPGQALTMVDLSCGGGRQLAANAQARPGHRYIGVDPSAGMIAVARRSAPALEWHQAPAEALPLADASVDYLSWQFAHHHAVDPQRCWSELARVLRPDGVAVLENIHPPAMQDWPLYLFFPGCWSRDQVDFPSTDQLQASARAVGLQPAAPLLTHHRRLVPLTELREAWSDRRCCSQLMTITESAWQRGLAELDRLALAEPGMQVEEHVAIMSLRCTKG